MDANGWRCSWSGLFEERELDLARWKDLAYARSEQVRTDKKRAEREAAVVRCRQREFTLRQCFSDQCCLFESGTGRKDDKKSTPRVNPLNFVAEPLCRMITPVWLR